MGPLFEQNSSFGTARTATVQRCTRVTSSLFSSRRQTAPAGQPCVQPRHTTTRRRAFPQATLTRAPAPNQLHGSCICPCPKSLPAVVTLSALLFCIQSAMYRCCVAVIAVPQSPCTCPCPCRPFPSFDMPNQRDMHVFFFDGQEGPWFYTRLRRQQLNVRALIFQELNVPGTVIHRERIALGWLDCWGPFVSD